MNVVPEERDNLNATPDRPYEVAQDELEHAVRETFSRQAATPYAPSLDPAAAVIRRANRIQRRRALAGMGLTAVAIVAVTTGALQLGADPPPNGGRVVIGESDQLPEIAWTPTLPPPSPDTGTPLAEVDLVLGDAIATAQGRRVTIVGAGPIERAHRLSDGRGWLAVGTPGLAGRFLWSVSPNGSVQVLLAGADEIVLDEKGRQVAWKQGAELASAQIINGELTAPARAEAPAEAVPLGFVGGAVLVRLAPDRPGHVLWRLHPGVLDPGPDRASARVFGALPDGRLVGEVVTDPPGSCLTLLDPVPGLTPAGPECGPRLDGAGAGSVSPDGRWLLVNDRSEGRAAAFLVDLESLGSAAEPVTAGPSFTGSVVWSAPGTAYYADAEGRVVRVDVGRAAAGRPATTLSIGSLPAGRLPVVVSGG
ncbi:TolB-like translocation protein [Micromonospora radicis]|uniref:WD40 repeat domain-containing protein n=1 Tax=Micromonospora radicis TaxID=1894971 RepID=A0A418MMX8_9ACTN|nr:hypothetical protein [Micromonospora radicis]RIV30853.1 hypothetical protein D2L64_26100 [Micromonospora radicis]